MTNHLQNYIQTQLSYMSYHQAHQYLFADQQQPQSIFQCIDFQPLGQYIPRSESARQIDRAQDSMIRQVQQGRPNAQQETRIIQEPDPTQNSYDKGTSIKQNFCKYFGKNVRRIVTQQLNSNSPQQTDSYLRFVLKNLKNTRKSIKQFLINDQRKSLYDRFRQFLPLQMRQQTMASQIFEEGTEYVRRLVCSKQAQMKAQTKTEAKKEEFRLFVQRTIRELRQNRMRGKDDKILKTERLNGDIKNQVKEKERRSTHQIITNPLISGQNTKLVDLQCFPAS